MPNDLRLSLKRKWFEMTKARIKTEDYREITPYWVNRLVKEFDWGTEDKHDWVTSNGLVVFKKFVDFSKNTMTLGYPSATDTDRIITFEHLGIEIGYGKEEWGAEPNKLYFIIKHGNPCQTKKNN